MAKSIVISHSSLDGALAQRLAELIRRCSLRMINVWHSSDQAAEAGLVPGQRWFDTIRSNLLESTAVILLLTPNSTKSSWVQFEAGFGAGVSDLEIMPLVLGVDIYDVPNPLSQWQIYKLTAADLVMTFLRKLFSRLDVHFDDDLFGPMVGDFVKECLDLDFAKPSSSSRSATENWLELRDYLDKKFFDVHQRMLVLGGKEANGAENFSGYFIQLENRMDGTSSRNPIRVEVDPRDTCQDILNRIYFEISNTVKPWTYLSSWIIRDSQTGARLIFREITDEIPAHFVFRLGRSLEVVALDKPYSGLDSAGLAEHDFVAN